MTDIYLVGFLIFLLPLLSCGFICCCFLEQVEVETDRDFGGWKESDF